MKRTSSLVILGLALVALGCGPVWMFPGGRLDGQVAGSPPADWSIADDIENVQLETKPEDPYSVNVWGAGLGDRFYVASGRGDDAAWAQHIAADPNVRLRVGETVYELRASRVEEDAERELFLAAVKRKYEWEPNDEERKSAVLFRLSRRDRP